MAPRAGLEPATTRLTAERSTIELPRNVIDYTNYYNCFSILCQLAFFSINSRQRPTLPGRTQVPSAQEGLTAVFGMGTGVTPPLLLPGIIII
jgi:hypothetical protein